MPLAQDYHHYASKALSMNLPSKNWAKRIQEEWKILENDLPDTIFVRVYESRMDLLRAVIIGAEGFCFCELVYYHSGGLRINSNLYECGKVCPSLLNTCEDNGVHNQETSNATVSHKPRNKSSKLTLRASLPLPARAEGFETLYRANIHCIDSEGVQYRFCRSI
ncbi:hypothetical protein ACOSQ2_007343 [Xanthoceras sorbifolium]